MAEPDPLLRVACFEVLIGTREFGFAQVGPLVSTDRLDDPSPAKGGFLPIVCRRALGLSTDLFDWRKAVASGKRDYRDVTIRQLSTPGGPVVNVWRLVRARPVRWSGPTFNALQDDVAFEEVELIFDDLVWLDPRLVGKER
jgi:phage tail-like protein